MAVTGRRQNSALTFDAFLSYNGEDRHEVEQFVRRLERAQIHVWFDGDQADAGRPFQDALTDGLTQSRSFILCLGKHGLGRWTREEVHAAVDRAAHDDGFRAITVLMPSLPPDFDLEEVPLFMKSRTWVDFRGRPNDPGQFDLLVRSIADASLPGGSEGLHSTPSRHEGTNSHMSQDTGTHRPLPAPRSQLKDNLDILKQFIAELRFTPMIGVGCSLVGRSNSSAWKAIAGRMAALLTVLEHESLPSRYLRSLAAVPGYDIRLPEYVPTGAVPLPTDSLASLQLALTRLGAEFGILFASTMLESASAVWDTVSYTQRIPDDHPQLETISRLLVEACEAAYALRATPEGRDPTVGLGAPGIYNHLIDLAVSFLDKHDLERLSHEQQGDGAFHDALTQIAAQVSRRMVTDDDAERNRELHIYQLEWIADALWHTFRFDKAAYARNDELSFQISLLADLHGERIDLPGAAQNAQATVKLSHDVIAAWFRQFGNDAPPEMQNLYDALALVLQDQFEAFRKTRERDPLEPVAFSSTYDLEMERALLRAPGVHTFHVVIPVYAYAKDEQEPDQGWLRGTLHHGQNVEDTEWEWFAEERELTKRDIQGPMLIKLHGSPLHTLPGGPLDDEYLPEYERFEHALVLSEHQFLENIVWKDRLPQFFNRVLLQSNRTYFFLGHSIREWSTRLRLYSQVYRRDSNPRTVARIAINRAHDPYRSAVLSAIGVQRWAGDLEEIPAVVEDVLG